MLGGREDKPEIFRGEQDSLFQLSRRAPGVARATEEHVANNPHFDGVGLGFEQIVDHSPGRGHVPGSPIDVAKALYGTHVARIKCEGGLILKDHCLDQVFILDQSSPDVEVNPPRGILCDELALQGHGMESMRIGLIDRGISRGVRFKQMEGVRFGGVIPKLLGHVLRHEPCKRA